MHRADRPDGAPVGMDALDMDVVGYRLECSWLEGTRRPAAWASPRDPERESSLAAILARMHVLCYPRPPRCGHHLQILAVRRLHDQAK